MPSSVQKSAGTSATKKWLCETWRPPSASRNAEIRAIDVRSGEPPREEVEDDDREHAVEHAPGAAEQDQRPVGRHDAGARVGRGGEVAARELLLHEDRDGDVRGEALRDTGSGASAAATSDRSAPRR